MKITFLIIDMQQIYLKEIAGIPKACEHINYVASLLRNKNHTVIHIKDMEGVDEQNDASYQIIPEIEINEKDLMVSKICSNAFWKTDLEKIVSENKTELLILSGFAAENCVLATYNGAKERGFITVILQNGILGNHEDVITQTYRDRNIISYPVIEALTK